MSTARRNGLRWLWLAAAVVILDQLTKLWITDHFAPYERVELLPVLDFTLMFNTGAAFSMLAGASGWQHWLFTGLAFVISAGILVALYRVDAQKQPVLAAALTLVLGGAVGNVIDRLRLGHVVDFIHAHWNDAYFPAFNVADSAITVGACLLLLDAWLDGRRARHGAQDAQTPGDEEARG